MIARQLVARVLAPFFALLSYVARLVDWLIVEAMIGVMVWARPDYPEPPPDHNPPELSELVDLIKSAVLAPLHRDES